jgi:hypothetical protein
MNLLWVVVPSAGVLGPLLKMNRQVTARTLHQSRELLVFGYRLSTVRWRSHKLFAILVGCFLQVAFEQSASGTDGNRLRTVALTSTPAVGTNSQFAGFSSPVLNGSGRTAFEAELPYDDPGDYSSNLRSHGIWSEAQGPLALLARGGDPAPGTDQEFERLSQPSINNLGQTVFRADFSGGFPFHTPDHGIFRGGNVGVDLLLRRGSPSPKPDVFNGEMSFTGFAPPLMNDQGDLGFIAALDNYQYGSGYQGVWVGPLRI